ncbi:MAG: helix-turn-helix transcriptional regulator [Hyphomicrobium sp.]
MSILKDVACDVTHDSQVLDCLLPMDEVLERVSISKTQLYRLINAGEFPKPVPMGRHRVAFLASEVQAWIKSRARLRDEGFGAETRRRRAIRAVGGRQ